MKTKVHRKISNKKKKRVGKPLVAEVVGCSREYVGKVLQGKRKQDTEISENIMLADSLLEEGMNKLIEEVKRVVAL
ncbi:MAG: hypothetical protein EPN37_10285 [Chitinophagaceae bacterium]|nr:MAG: hypothetical protein EPN37_10285 [Chitinophagaceae bacterium]